MYPGTFWKSFYVYGEGNDTKIDMTDLVRSWAKGESENHGLMIRDPLHQSQGLKVSICLKYYSNLLLSVKYKE